ncbi:MULTISPECIES: molecular chaperone HtpG [unclassified Eubacterium (in: firmicutes)]|uniref:molecular chaperone HtpG n=2 Tax=Eubacteriaceae TaxID=186806 RepID=UPI000E47FA45|nr:MULTISPECIES: molecular chaperone HtpG [unclassified Eubacterium (in: firmicutes)]RGF51818.1 molecular chaperone HtpG [Eubacterium sp. AF36-5BH]RHP20531.1 molecular chaperone HtpG [Eubacterium sp. AF34-35BH]
MAKNGSLSINSENIFPIIKKWLYSDHDIFFRELVSNGCDAITKLKKLDMIGEANVPSDEEFKIQVLANPELKTLTFIDNGIGMTEDEVDEYINQIAFSGAEAFLEQYKDKTSEDQIIGHFGLGFYSAFMVADRVTINTLSYKDGAKAVLWDCEDGMDFTMSDSDKTTRGTEITLYLNEDSVEFCNLYRAEEVLNKYCSFMPIEIFLSDPTKEPEYETILEEEVTDKDTVVEHIVEPAKTEEKENEDGTKETVEVEPEKKKAKVLKRPVSISDTTPLWTKHPNECSDEEYKAFYHKVFMDYKEPLFWIHLNMDYPFNLKGILYFPKINTEYESIEGTIKLYNNQVFIADNIKEVIPEFLMLLKGVIDCPDLPLNVSRSALQNDGFVKKISDYITKKVADKLSGMCKTDKENYEKYWDDISPFIKFGCLKDEKFCDKMSDYVLFKNLDNKYLTFKEALEENKEKHENTIFYTNDPVQQSQYVNMFKDQGIDAIILKDNIDQPFISQLEAKNEGVKFKRIDDELNDSFTEELSEDESKDLTDKLTDAFKKALGRDITIKVQKLKDENISSMITVSEETRRMQDMMKMYGMAGMDPSMFGGAGETLTLNANNDLVKYIVANPEGENTELICKQLYDLALISHTPLNPDSMTAFIERSNKILKILTK